MKNELSFQVDLDQERGRTPRGTVSNTHHVTIRKTGAVNLSALEGYLKGQMGFDNSVLEAISRFLVSHDRYDNSLQ